jgi:hypothetical protein
MILLPFPISGYAIAVLLQHLQIIFEIKQHINAADGEDDN